MRQSVPLFLSLFACNLAVTHVAQAANHHVRSTFLKDCAVVAPAISPQFHNLCVQLSDEKTSAQLIRYDHALVAIAQDLRKFGPDVAKHVIAQCAAIATDKASSPLDLQFCLETSSLDVQGLAKGSGVKNYTAKSAQLVGKVQADERSPGGPGWNSLSEDQKSKFRATAVHSCAAEAPAYVAAVCAGIALHEDFLAKRPYGPNGEIAKQFDTLMHGFTAAGSAQQKADGFAQQALRGIGVPAAAIVTPGAAPAVAARIAQQTLGAAAKVHESVKQELQKRTGIKLPF